MALVGETCFPESANMHAALKSAAADSLVARFSL